MLHNDRKCRHLVPTWQDIDVLESLDAALGTLSDFTDMLSAEDFVTISAILPVIHHILKRKVLNIGDDDTQLTKDIKTLAILNKSTLMLKFVSYSILLLSWILGLLLSTYLLQLKLP